MTSGLSITNLSHSYGEVDVLCGIDLRIPAGEICAVLGQSGSGKSTLAKCVMFLERPKAGSVTFGGIDVDLCTVDIEDRALIALRKTLGYLPQSSLLLPHLTAQQNVMLPLVEAQKASKAAAATEALSALKSVELEMFASRHPWRLSGGQQQRVAIARAMVIKPKFLFLDEPTAALDVKMSRIIGEYVRGYANSHGAVAMILTHNLAFARRFCDSVAFLSEGSIKWHLRVEDVEIEAALEDLA